MAISWDRNSSITIGAELPLRCAAQYVRMSTEHQKYSTDNQQDAIAVYAAERGYRIVKTYADEGKSGLKIEGRRGLQQLLNDIKTGQSDYDAVLVYDISRWGRFQDPDESASYELLCRQAGIEVHYCAEQFENDGSISSSIIKTVKRAMAGEYSRELSVKVFAGHANLIRLGFRQGSAPGYGLRRLLVDQDGSPKGILNSGEHKSIQTDRVMLVPGPWQEQEVVREIFGRMANGDTERNIANDLNNRKIAFSFGKLWTRATIHNLVINEKYIGHNVWGRKSCKLKQGYTVNHPQDWIRRDNAFEAIVDVEIFRRVQDIIAARSKKLSDDEMLERLRAILECNRRLSAIIIDEQDDAPSSQCYRARFGSLLRAYTLVGFVPRQNYEFLEASRRLKAYQPSFETLVISRLEAMGVQVERTGSDNRIRIANEIHLCIVIARCSIIGSGGCRWKLRLRVEQDRDLVLAVRMNVDNDKPLDYYLIPNIDMRTAALHLFEHNGLTLWGRADLPGSADRPIHLP